MEKAYLIYNYKDNEQYILSFKNEIEAKNWVIKNLDTSKKWYIENFINCC